MKNQFFIILFVIVRFSVNGQTYPVDTSAFHIVSAIGGKFLTVKNSNDEAGATLEIRDHPGSISEPTKVSQIWTLQEFGSKHSYFIKGRQGKVIDVKEGNTQNGATVHMWNFGGYSNHRWTLIDAGNNYFYIKNWATGKLLEVKGGINENGRQVWSYQKNNTASQKWRFVKVQENANDELLSGEPTNCEHGFSFIGTQDIELNSARIYYCPQKKDEWESITKQQFGMSAKNRTNHYIGWSAADKDGIPCVGKNWYPLADMKKVHCGKLCEIGYFDAVEETSTGKSWFADRHEKDFNLHVPPFSPFMYQIDKSIINYNTQIEFCNFNCKQNWASCGSSLAMEGEITPDDEFLANPNNPWLGIKNLNADSSSLFLNQNFGMYGPWLREWVHCNHPEIHPAEMIWSETIFPNIKYLGLFQDDSDRFGNYTDYPDYNDANNAYQISRTSTNLARREEMKRKVHPWVSTPLSGQFYICIEIDPTSAKKTTYTIDVQKSREVVTKSQSSKIPAREYTGKTRSIKNNGVEIFRVTELQDDENDVAVRFDLFKEKNSNKILGYMVISAAVSRDLNGKEGYMMIRLDRNN